jgi:hypothetical protein
VRRWLTVNVLKHRKYEERSISYVQECVFLIFITSNLIQRITQILYLTWRLPKCVGDIHTSDTSPVGFLCRRKWSSEATSTSVPLSSYCCSIVQELTERYCPVHTKILSSMGILGISCPSTIKLNLVSSGSTFSNHWQRCKIWGFHGGHYEECRLLGYKNPVHTWQETHYVSTTALRRLMPCNIWGFHSSDYEEWRFLGCYAMWLL